MRESASATAEQALRLGVIDVIATDIGSLIETIDGRDVPVANGQTLTLDLAGAPIREVNPGPLVGFLHAVLDPNVAFIFFWFGLALIVLELFLPGGVAGTLGTVMFVLSLVALGMLPVQLIGVLLLVGSMVFFVLELMHPGVGALAAGGVIALVLGGLFLFDSSVPGVAVSPLVIVPVTAFALFFFLVVIRSAIKLRTKKAITRDEQLVGRAGVVVRDLDPAGVVQVASEQWSAETAGGTLRAGDRVRVVGMQGLKLKVEPVDEPAPVASASAEGRDTVIPLLIGVGVVLLLLIIILPQAIKIVREYQRLMVFRLGRAIGAKGPGLVILIPFIDKGVWVDLRELYLEIPHQTAITEDNATISIDFIVFYRVDGRGDVGHRGRATSPARPRTSRRPRSVRWSATWRSTTCSPSASR